MSTPRSTVLAHTLRARGPHPPDAYAGRVPRVVVPRSAADLYASLTRALGADDDVTVTLEPLAHDEGALPEDAVLVVRTSGSTGSPREVVLTRAALRASIDATAARLGGHGRWLLAIPWHHVAGAQVVARSVVAGTHPADLPDAPFTPALLAEHATAFFDDPATQRAYLSLVPTQLHRVVEAARAADPAGVAAAGALARFDAVLVGGAASSPTCSTPPGRSASRSSPPTGCRRRAAAACTTASPSTASGCAWARRSASSWAARSSRRATWASPGRRRSAPTPTARAGS
ncbi:AMP-binding protein [Luteimicrobium album]